MSEKVGGGFNPNIKLTRRAFLRLALTAGIGAGVGAASSNVDGTKNVIKAGWDFLRNITKEPLNPIPNNVLILDFAPEQQSDNLLQSFFPSNDQLLRNLLGSDYMSEVDIFRRYGLDIAGSLGDKQDTFRKLFEKNPKVAVAMALKSDFSSHGENVGNSMQSAWARLKLKSKPTIHPLQELIGNFGFERDDLGNLGFLGDISSDKVVEILTKYPNEDIVNCSWQFGKVGFFYLEKFRNLYRPTKGNSPKFLKYDNNGKIQYTISFSGANESNIEIIEGTVFIRNNRGQLIEAATTSDGAIDQVYDRLKEIAPIEQQSTPSIQIVEGYKRDTVENNLPFLFKTCKAFPNKLFIAAAGNLEDNLRRAKDRLKDDWPENLILVGEWNPYYPKQNNTDNVVLQSQVYGADLYVDNSAWDISAGSSFSTAVVSAISSAIKSRKNLSVKEVKQHLLQSLSDRRTYQALKPLSLGRDDDQPAQVLNLEKVQSYIR